MNKKPLIKTQNNINFDKSIEEAPISIEQIDL